MWWANIGAGIIANIATIGLTLAVGALWLTGRRRALLRFWGIENTRKIRIYISHLRIQQGGALDAQGTRRSYQGSVVTQLESEMGSQLRNLFVNALPGGAVQPDWVKSLLVVGADVTVSPAPPAAASIDSDGTVVTIGSPAYNPVSGSAEQNCQSAIRFAPGNVAIQLPGNITTNDGRHCFVVRLRAGGRLWFYAAGLSEPGTAGAAHYLATSWRRLDRLYRTSPSFFVVLEVVGNDFRHAHVISEGALEQPVTS